MKNPKPKREQHGTLPQKTINTQLYIEIVKEEEWHLLPEHKRKLRELALLNQIGKAGAMWEHFCDMNMIPRGDDI